MLQSIDADVAGQSNGFAEGIPVRLTLTGDVKAGAMIRAGPHNGQACREIHSSSKTQRFEGGETLVMIHREDAIKLLEGS